MSFIHQKLQEGWLRGGFSHHAFGLFTTEAIKKKKTKQNYKLRSCVRKTTAVEVLQGGWRANPATLQQQMSGAKSNQVQLK